MNSAAEEQANDPRGLGVVASGVVTVALGAGDDALESPAVVVVDRRAGVGLPNDADDAEVFGTIDGEALLGVGIAV